MAASSNDPAGPPATRSPDEWPLKVSLTVVSGATDSPVLSFITGTSSKPLTIGAQGDWVVTGPGVHDAHLLAAFDGRRLYVAAASAAAPVTLRGVAIDTGWWMVEVPSELRLGEHVCMVADSEEYSGRISTQLPMGVHGDTLPVKGVTTSKSGTWPVEGVAPAAGPSTEGPALPTGSQTWPVVGPSDAPRVGPGQAPGAGPSQMPGPPAGGGTVPSNAQPAFGSTLPSSPPEAGDSVHATLQVESRPAGVPSQAAPSFRLPPPPEDMNNTLGSAKDLPVRPSHSEPPPNSTIRAKRQIVSPDQALSIAAIAIAIVALGILVTTVVALVLD